MSDRKNTQEIRCIAKTKKGKQCKRYQIIDKMCWQHWISSGYMDKLKKEVELELENESDPCI